MASTEPVVDGEGEEEVWEIPKNTADRQAAERAYNAYQDWTLYSGKNAQKRVTVTKFNHDYGNTRKSMGAVDNIGRTAEVIADKLDDLDWYLSGSNNSRIAAIENQMRLEKEKLEAAQQKAGYGENPALQKITDEYHRVTDRLREELRQYELPSYVGPFGKKALGDSHKLGRDFHYTTASTKPEKVDWRLAMHQDDQAWALRKLPKGCPQ